MSAAEEKQIVDRARKALEWRPEGFVHPEATGARWVQRKQKDFTFRGMPSWVREMYRISERNAKRRKIPFTLNRQEFREIVERAAGRCMMTGIEFEFERYEGSCRRPFAPSLDRIDSSKGYSADNCRLICVLVNLAMNQWGLGPLMKVAKNLITRQQELHNKEQLRDEYCPAEFITSTEFCRKHDLNLTQHERCVLAGLTGRMCWKEGIDTGNIGDVKAYPETSLLRAYQRMAISRRDERIAVN